MKQDELIYKVGDLKYITDTEHRDKAYEDGYRCGVMGAAHVNGGGYGHPTNQRFFNMGYGDGKADVQVFVHDGLFSLAHQPHNG